MNIFMFHLMPWPDLPASYEGWAWVKCPNSLYDPRRGHELYNRYLDELEYAEKLALMASVSTSIIRMPTAPCRRRTSSLRCWRGAPPASS